MKRFFLQVDVPSCFVALVLENCQLPYPNHGHVVIADPSPILFYPISSTEVRCMVDVPGQKLPPIANGEMANYLKTVVAPQVWDLTDSSVFYIVAFLYSIATVKFLVPVVLIYDKHHFMHAANCRR